MNGMMEPEIRFKGFEGEWEPFSLKDVCEINPQSPLPETFEYVDLESVVGTSMVSHRTENRLTAPSRAQRLAKGGDIFYQTVRPYQKNNYLFVNQNTNFVFSTGYAQLRTKIDSKYLFNILQTDRFVNQVLLNCTGTSYPAINPTALSNLKIGITRNKTEQKQIASCFKSLDALIQSATKKIASLKQLKSASLVSMFPQEGEVKPRVRFKGFKEDWKTVPFDIVFRYLKNNTLSRADLNETLGSARNIHYGDILIKFGTLIDIRKDDLPYITNHFLANQLTSNCKLQKGDIIFADAAEDSTVGKCTEIAFIGEEKVVAGLHTIPCRTLFEFSEGYLGFYLNSPSYHNQLLPLMQCTKISSISKSVLLNTSISFPSSIAEQRQIASFFRSLDTQIFLETQRLDKLKQIKSACLDKMFV